MRWIVVLFMVVMMTSCRTSGQSGDGPGAGFELIGTTPQFVVYQKDDVIAVRSTTCPDLKNWLYFEGISGIPKKDAVTLVTIMAAAQAPHCFAGQPGSAAGDAAALEECHDVYFKVTEPSTYHFTNVCPGSSAAGRPTEEFCGPVAFLGESVPQQRCLTVFADQS